MLLTNGTTGFVQLPLDSERMNSAPVYLLTEFQIYRREHRLHFFHLIQINYTVCDIGFPIQYQYAVCTAKVFADSKINFNIISLYSKMHKST